VRAAVICFCFVSATVLRPNFSAFFLLKIWGVGVCLLPSGVRREAGDAAGWVRQPHGLEVHRAWEGRGKP
jgi:hypothetical protein